MKEGKIIGIASGKGGVGKTTVVVNLASALLELGNRVCIVDGNVTTSNLGLHLGTIDYPATIHDVLKGRMKIIDAVYIHPSNMHMIAGSLSLADLRGLSVGLLRKNLKKLAKHYDYILLDTAPGLEEKSMKVITSCDELLIITIPELPAVTDAIKIIEVCRKKRVKIKGIVINRIRGEEFELRAEEISDLYKIPIVALIPEDVDVAKSIAMKIPLVLADPKSKISEEFFNLAVQIMRLDRRRISEKHKKRAKRKH
jgi:cell division ATPase MinD